MNTLRHIQILRLQRLLRLHSLQSLTHRASDCNRTSVTAISRNGLRRLQKLSRNRMRGYAHLRLRASGYAESQCHKGFRGNVTAVTSVTAKFNRCVGREGSAQ